jgi:hypothetical protein
MKEWAMEIREAQVRHRHKELQETAEALRWEDRQRDTDGSTGPVAAARRALGRSLVTAGVLLLDGTQGRVRAHEH